MWGHARQIYNGHMYAIRLHAFGPAENLCYEEVEDPEPGPGQVRVAVRAAGVHLVDTVLRSGNYSGGPGAARRRRPDRAVRLVGRQGRPDPDHHAGPVRPRHHRGGGGRPAGAEAAGRPAGPGGTGAGGRGVGELVPLVHSFPLKDAAAAHAALETRATTGKVVLVP